MQIHLTRVFQKVAEGYIGFVEEVPGANTQAPTLEEARTSLQEAMTLVLEANRLLAEEVIVEREVIREPQEDKRLLSHLKIYPCILP